MVVNEGDAGGSGVDLVIMMVWKVNGGTGSE